MNAGFLSVLGFSYIISIDLAPHGSLAVKVEEQSINQIAVAIG